MFNDVYYMTFDHMCLMVACVEVSPYGGRQMLSCWSAAFDFIQVLFEPLFETSFCFTYILFFAVCSSQYVNHICGLTLSWAWKVYCFPVDVHVKCPSLFWKVLHSIHLKSYSLGQSQFIRMKVILVEPIVWLSICE